MKEIETVIQKLAKDLFGQQLDAELTIPDEQFGDFATNVALRLAAKLNTKPRLIADELAVKLKQNMRTIVSDVSVAGPGFINIRLNDQSLWEQMSKNPNKSLKGQTVVAEYSDPNPFKVLHAGHLYTSVVGDAMANLMEAAGADVYRVNFGGDVGLHVGKSMWAILDNLGGEHPEKLDMIPVDQRSDWMAEAYVRGTNAYEEDEAAKAEIISLNKKVYQIHSENDQKSPFAQIYWTCRKWSYDYFNEFYTLIGSHFERYYPESLTAEIGLKTVKKHVGKVFEKSDGAIVFRGEKHGLHTRVFINSEGLPTYEAKDIGLIMAKNRDYKFDKSVVITGNEQEQYMSVVLKAVEQFAPELAKATVHLTHGMVKLKGGVKMSSRKGNILRAADVLEAASQANKELTGSQDIQTSLAAVKYSMLKVRMGGDIIYDPKESVNILGNSGPYLQYAHARARSILSKSKAAVLTKPRGPLEAAERSLVRKLGEYPRTVEAAYGELMPHHLCSYLYELAQSFNSFYEKNRVVGDKREDLRAAIVKSYAKTLKSGLGLLNIQAPDKM